MAVSNYSKAIVLIISAGMSIYISASSDGVVSPLDYTNIVIAILTAVTVYLVPNLSTGIAKYAKAIIAFAGAAATAVATIVGTSANWDGVTTNDWLSVLLAGLAAVGLFIVPNTQRGSGDHVAVGGGE